LRIASRQRCVYINVKVFEKLRDINEKIIAVARQFCAETPARINVRCKRIQRFCFGAMPHDNRFVEGIATLFVKNNLAAMHGVGHAYINAFSCDCGVLRDCLICCFQHNRVCRRTVRKIEINLRNRCVVFKNRRLKRASV
jgi:hypothetical protein